MTGRVSSASADERGMWDLRSLAECLLATPKGAPINEGLARDLARTALVELGVGEPLAGESPRNTDEGRSELASRSLHVPGSASADEQTRERIAEIAETLMTGGYDGSEGEDGSRDTTWTDFGEVCGIAERLAAQLAASEAKYAETLEFCARYEKRAEGLAAALTDAEQERDEAQAERDAAENAKGLFALAAERHLEKRREALALLRELVEWENTAGRWISRDPSYRALLKGGSYLLGRADAATLTAAQQKNDEWADLFAKTFKSAEGLAARLQETREALRERDERLHRIQLFFENLELRGIMNIATEDARAGVSAAGPLHEAEQA